MEGTFLKECKPCENICRGLLRELFTKLIDQVFLDLIKELYSNIKIKYLSLKTSVKGTHITIHKCQIGRMFDLPFYEEYYSYYEPLKIMDFKLSSDILSFVMNHMGEKSSLLEQVF